MSKVRIRKNTKIHGCKPTQGKQAPAFEAKSQYEAQQMSVPRPCVICTTEFRPSGMIYKCKCGIKTCNDCAFNWAKSQINDQLQKEEPEWRCPQPDPVKTVGSGHTPCSKFTISEIIDSFLEMFNKSKETSSNKSSVIFRDDIKPMIDELTQLQLKHYLIHEEDIRTCPSPECNFSGSVLIDEGTGNIQCESPLECPQCGHKWRDPLQHVTKGACLVRALRSIPNSYEKTKNYLRMLFISKQCQTCGVLIQKTSGCNKMVCQKCKTEFCWLCLGNFKNYKHDSLMASNYCEQLRYARDIFFLVFGCILVLKLVSLGFTFKDESFYGFELPKSSFAFESILVLLNLANLIFYGSAAVSAIAIPVIVIALGTQDRSIYCWLKDGSPSIRTILFTLLICLLLSDWTHAVVNCYVLIGLTVFLAVMFVGFLLCGGGNVIIFSLAIKIGVFVLPKTLDALFGALIYQWTTFWAN